MLLIILSQWPLYPTGTDSARLVIREMEVVVVQPVWVFIKQILRASEALLRPGAGIGAQLKAALPNELEWLIESGPFHRSQEEQSVKTSPAPLRSEGLNAAF